MLDAISSIIIIGFLEVENERPIQSWYTYFHTALFVKRLSPSSNSVVIIAAGGEISFTQ